MGRDQRAGSGAVGHAHEALGLLVFLAAAGASRTADGADASCFAAGPFDPAARPACARRLPRRVHGNAQRWSDDQTCA
jgi:hypothetical protein